MTSPTIATRTATLADPAAAPWNHVRTVASLAAAALLTLALP